MQDNRKEEFVKLLDRFRSGDDFIITTHKSCDPDGMGSELGLSFLLEKIGKKYQIINPDKTPDRYLFLDPQSRIHYIDPDRLQNPHTKSTVVIVDNSEISRIGDLQNYINSEKSNLISIDHHDGIANFPGLFCFPEIGSTSEIIYELITLAGFEPDYNTSVALLAGIIVDTGQFKYKKTRPRTHRIAASILDVHTINQEELIRSLFEDNSHKVLYLKRDIYSTMQYLPDYKLVSIEITKAMLTKYGFYNNPAEGLTGELLSAADVQIAVSFVEQENGIVKMSFRSKGNYNVCNVAKEFSGGGHSNASGATSRGTIDKVKSEVIDKLKKMYLETHNAI